MSPFFFYCSARLYIGAQLPVVNLRRKGGTEHRLLFAPPHTKRLRTSCNHVGPDGRDVTFPRARRHLALPSDYSSLPKRPSMNAKKKKNLNKFLDFHIADIVGELRRARSRPGNDISSQRWGPEFERNSWQACGKARREATVEMTYIHLAPFSTWGENVHHGCRHQGACVGSRLRIL